MKTRAIDMFMDFLNVIFFILIVAFAIFFFILWQYFDSFLELMKNFAIFGVFGLGLIITLKLDYERYKKRKAEGNLGIELNLTYKTKMVANITIFALPLLLCLLPLLFQGTVSLLNLFQALLAFFIILAYRQSLFGNAQ